MTYLIKSGADFVNRLKCPECFEQVNAIDPVERENIVPAPMRPNYLVPRPRFLGYDLLPCMCFLPREDFTLIWRQTEEGHTVEFERNIDCGCKK